jgi:hypothetical protein
MEAAVAKIAAIEEYQEAFQQVFGRPPNGPDLVGALASYERTQVSFDSPFDHFIAGEENASSSVIMSLLWRAKPKNSLARAILRPSIAPPFAARGIETHIKAFEAR